VTVLLTHLVTYTVDQKSPVVLRQERVLFKIH